MIGSQEAPVRCHIRLAESRTNGAHDDIALRSFSVQLALLDPGQGGEADFAHPVGQRGESLILGLFAFFAGPLNPFEPVEMNLEVK